MERHSLVWKMDRHSAFVCDRNRAVARRRVNLELERVAPFKRGHLPYVRVGCVDDEPLSNKADHENEAFAGMSDAMNA